MVAVVATGKRKSGKNRYVPHENVRGGAAVL
jgi:hypothetical protein